MLARLEFQKKKKLHRGKHTPEMIGKSFAYDGEPGVTEIVVAFKNLIIITISGQYTNSVMMLRCVYEELSISNLREIFLSKCSFVFYLTVMAALL